MSVHLVTGVAGFIGSTLAESLLGDGQHVVGIDSVTDYYSTHHKERNLAALRDYNKFRFVHADLLDEGEVTKDLVNSASVIYHQAGQPGVRASWSSGFATYVRDNVLATQRLLELIENKQETKFVYASSSSIYGNADSWPCTEQTVPKPFSPYGVTKLSAEHLVSLYAENFGLQSVSLRYFTVYGPRQRPDMAFNKFINAILSHGEISIYGDGEQIRDFTYVDDIVAANRLAGALGGAGEVFNLSGGSNASVNQVLDILGVVSGLEVRRNYVETQAGDVRRTGGDSAAAEKTLGWKASVALQEGLTNQVAWQKSNFTDF